MPYEDFIAILQTLPEGITNIGLTNWSEPFLNKDIIKIIEYVKANRPEVKIWVSSNGNAFRDNLATQTVLAGLDFLDITISGLSDESYRKYHKHGKIDRVFQAIDEITRAKQKFHLLKPRLTINYLLFPYNIVDERTIEDTFAQRLSYRDQQKFIDAIRIVRKTILGTQAVLQEIRHRSPETYQLFKYTTHFKNLCLQLFLNPAVRADGSVFPCCITDYRDELVMGNLHENRFDDIWESEKYRRFRESFLRGENQICNTCFFMYLPAPLFDFKHFNLRLRQT